MFFGGGAKAAVWILVKGNVKNSKKSLAINTKVNFIPSSMREYVCRGMRTKSRCCRTVAIPNEHIAELMYFERIP